MRNLIGMLASRAKRLPLFTCVFLGLATSATAREPATPDSLLDAARSAYEAARYDESARLLESYLSRHPEALDARLRLGWSRYRMGEFEAAGEEFEAALSADPGFEDARIGLGYVRLQTTEAAEAAETFRTSLSRRPGDPDALRGLMLAAIRAPDDATLRRQGLDAGVELAAAGSVDPGVREGLEKLVAGVGAGFERRPAAEVPGAMPVEVKARAAEHYLRVRDGDGAWRPLFVKGFNLGAALPGRFPTQFPEDEATYRSWLSLMADLGANAVRLYTLLPPAFYRALADHNSAQAARSLRLIQGVWAELPPRHDFSDPGYVVGLEAEIARVVDAVHGNLLLAPRPGHAWGLYDADVSGSLLAYVVGREWEPFAVADFDAIRPDTTEWSGRWLRVEEGRAMECWVARMCDFTVGYEVDRYRQLHPVTFANWPTLDPLHHPTESTRAEEDVWRTRHGIPHPEKLRARIWEDDLIGLDATRILPTEAMKAGFFASYHVYPNFPDFMNLETGYDSARDHEGPSRYAGYLRALKAHHGTQPVLVAEFGISTSRGTAHVHPGGWNHGGHDERSQGRLVARMLRSIHDEGYAGGVVFEFLDEWFKGTWSVAPLEVPAERRRMWFNAESPEQAYGVLGVRPAGASLRLDGDPSDWEDVPVLAISAVAGTGWSDLRLLKVHSDEGYVYALLVTGGGPGPPDFSRTAFRLAVDTYDPGRGERELPPPGRATLPTGAEFLVEIAGPGESWVTVSEPYEPYARVDGGPLVSPVDGSGRFVHPVFETNRERFGRDGTRYPAVRVDRGELRFGSLDPDAPDYDTRADVSVGAAAGTVEIRLPWGLLNVSDPSSLRVLHREGAGMAFETVRTEGFRIYAFAVDRRHPEAEPLDRIPAAREPAPPYLWKAWEEPSYRLELKAGAGQIAETMHALPDLIVPGPVPTTGGGAGAD